MGTSSRNWPSFAAVFLLLLSFFSLAFAQPVAPASDRTPIQRRDLKPITEQEYVDYLKKWFGDKTDHFLAYSGQSEKQLEEFKKANRGYYSYDNLFNAFKFDEFGNPVLDKNGNKIIDPDHPWFKTFDKYDGPETRLDDGEASSRALARVATGKLLVFGAAEYATLGKDSFYTREEAPIIKDGVKTKRLSGIYHMKKDATRVDQVMAIEDENGKFSWQAGSKPGDKNASGKYVSTSPPVTPKNSPPATPTKGSPPGSPKSVCRKV